jgi:hypothetical protein
MESGEQTIFSWLTSVAFLLFTYLLMTQYSLLPTYEQPTFFTYLPTNDPIFFTTYLRTTHLFFNYLPTNDPIFFTTYQRTTHFFFNYLPTNDPIFFTTYLLTTHFFFNYLPTNNFQVGQSDPVVQHSLVNHEGWMESRQETIFCCVSELSCFFITYLLRTQFFYYPPMKQNILFLLPTCIQVPNP